MQFTPVSTFTSESQRIVIASSGNFSDTFLPPLENFQYRGHGSHCLCWNGSLESDLEADCRCSGDQLLEIPKNISGNVRRLVSMQHELLLQKYMEHHNLASYYIMSVLTEKLRTID
ncbi:hypothetical protein J6590_039664 [Homalodisca vitripennis]|nr:hypothetical protein J6590_039664 [Homalodisca vitripennis]